MTSEISHPLVAAVYDPIVDAVDRTMLGPHRADLVSGLTGEVLEPGVGTGAMFPHVKPAFDAGDVETYEAIEPDPHMRARGIRRARSLDLPVTIRDARAEELPYPDNRFDIVIAAMVFCTIADREQALAEICRVLRPGGELRLLEHVLADDRRRMIQQAVEPLWRRVAGGCHPTRATDRFVIRHSPFRPIALDRIDTGITPIRPFIRGRFRLPE